MTKYWFKYRNGYVNIDSENFYLTNTGNWSETTKLEEKTSETTTKKKAIKKEVISTILFLVQLIIGEKYFWDKDNIYGVIFIVLPMIITGFYMYYVMRSEFGETYKVPLEKLKKVEVNKRTLKIDFINGEGQQDSELIKEIDSKGLEIIEKLKRRLCTTYI